MKDGRAEKERPTVYRSERVLFTKHFYEVEFREAFFVFAKTFFKYFPV